MIKEPPSAGLATAQSRAASWAGTGRGLARRTRPGRPSWHHKQPARRPVPALTLDRGWLPRRCLSSLPMVESVSPLVRNRNIHPLPGSWARSMSALNANSINALTPNVSRDPLSSPDDRISNRSFLRSTTPARSRPAGWGGGHSVGGRGGTGQSFSGLMVHSWSWSGGRGRY
jgi:hypothetical protein